MAEITTDNRIHHAGLGLLNTAPLHAIVLGLNQNRQTFGLAEALNLVSQDHHRLFLDVGTGKDPIGNP